MLKVCNVSPPSRCIMHRSDSNQLDIRQHPGRGIQLVSVGKEVLMLIDDQSDIWFLGVSWRTLMLSRRSSEAELEGDLVGRGF